MRHIIMISATLAMALVSLVGSAAAGVYSDAVLADGPASYWTFDESASGTGTAFDAVDGNHGTFVGTATRTAGLAGVGEVAGIHHYLSYPESISSGYGFTAIIVAWLAKLNPVNVILSALFFAGILVGGDAIQISLGLPAATVQIFNGTLLVFLIMGDFFLKNQVTFQWRAEGS